MQEKINIIGAGLSGLIAGYMINDTVKILEKQKELPNNHNAVLRFRSTSLADATNLHFREVNVIRCAKPYLNPAADAMWYSKKVTGTFTGDRSISNIDTDPVKRYIAPKNLIDILYKQIGEESFVFGFDLEEEWGNEELHQVPIISTMPMPELMRILGYDHDIEFRHMGATHIRAKIVDPADVYMSVYDPDPDSPLTRVSITGDELMIEAKPISKLQHYALEVDNILWRVGNLIGKVQCELFKHSDAKYAKILPIPEEKRKHFVRWATENHNIYSLGRYATWRPKLLLDDVVQDVRLITRMIEGQEDPKYKSNLIGE